MEIVGIILMVLGFAVFAINIIWRIECLEKQMAEQIKFDKEVAKKLT